MNSIEIGGNEMSLEDADERWIRKEIKRSLEASGGVCIRVSFQEPALKFTLSTADCSSSGGAKYELTRREQEVWELWKKRGLGDPGLPKGKLAGALTAFLHQV